MRLSSEGRSVARRPRAKRLSSRSRHPAFEVAERYDQRRAAIVETAVHLFNRSGFYATSIEDIARELGLSKTLLYHYFSNKAELLYECYLHSLDSVRAGLQQAAVSGGTGRDKLEAYIRRQFDDLAGAKGAAWVLSDVSALTTRQRHNIRKQSRELDSMLQQLLIEGMADGSIVPTEPKITEFFVIGALNWLPHWYRPGRLTGKELAEIFLRLILDGLRPRT
jgi:TetR/AcrR family transcriptional regulator